MSDNIVRGERGRRRVAAGAAIWRSALVGALILGGLLVGSRAEAQHVVQVGAHEATGLLGAEDGRAIVDVALEQLALWRMRGIAHTWCMRFMRARDMRIRTRVRLIFTPGMRVLCG